MLCAGSNPPLTVVEGYFNRIWKDLGIDKVAQIKKGVFMVRFHSNEGQLKGECRYLIENQ